MAAIIQVWSAPSCEVGAICYGALAPWISASGSEATGTPAGFRVAVTRDVADRASLAEGRCLRVLSQSRGEQWWFVSSVTDSDGDANIVQVTAGPLRQLLTVRGLVRDGDTFAFPGGKITVTDLLTTRVLTNLAEDGLSWLSLGPIDATEPIEVGALNRLTRGGVLDLVERETGDTAVLRPLYTGAVLTGFELAVVRDVAAGLDTVPLAVGAQIATLQRTRDALRAATVVVPFSASDAPMEQTTWAVDSTIGTAPAWIVLRDPASGNPWPIREDDQLIGAYLQQRDGTQRQILDSRQSDSAVQVAAVGSLAPGDEVTIVRNTAGAPVVELTSPAGVASSRGRLVGTVSTRVTDVRRNLAVNPRMASWSGLTTAPGWSAAGDTSSISPSVGQYPRATPTTWSGTITTTYTAGTPYTSVSYTGAGPGAILLSRETIRITNGVQTVDCTVADSVGIHQANGSGAGTVVVNSFTPAVTFSSGAAVSLLAASSRRPALFPDDGLTLSTVLALHRAGSGGALASALRRIQNTPITLPLNSARPVLHVAAGFTWRNRTGGGSVTPGGGLGLLDTNTGTYGTLLTSSAPTISIPDGGTAHETLTAAFTMTAAEPFAVALYSADEAQCTTFVRWVSLWLDRAADAELLAPVAGRDSNTLWHRSQDVLASAGQGTRYTARGVDLERLRRKYGVLALGQSVRALSPALGVNTVERIVKLDYEFAAEESLSLELGAITPRLTGVTVSL